MRVSMLFGFGGELEDKWISSRSKLETAMITDWLAKRLFPRLEPYRQRREIRTLMAALLVGVLVAGVVVGLLILMNSAGG